MSTRRMVAAVVMVALVGLGGAAAWIVVSNSAGGRFCTVAGAQGPLGDSPEEAFALWWDGTDSEGFARWGESTSADIDFERDGRDYQWHYATGRWIQIDINHPREYGEVISDDWMVTAVNKCERSG